jgi:hypothetical protein
MSIIQPSIALSRSMPVEHLPTFQTVLMRWPSKTKILCVIDRRSVDLSQVYISCATEIQTTETRAISLERQTFQQF